MMEKEQNQCCQQHDDNHKICPQEYQNDIELIVVLISIYTVQQITFIFLALTQ